MKRLLSIITLFFALAFSFMLESCALHSQPIDTIGYIQNVKTETVVLVSNNILGGEISSYQEENSSNYLGNSPVILSFISDNTLLDKTKSHLNGCFIHNLSTNKEKVNQIRAP